MEEQDEYENPYGDIDENSTSFIEEILALTEMGIFRETRMETLDRRRR